MRPVIRKQFKKLLNYRKCTYLFDIVLGTEIDKSNTITRKQMCLVFTKASPESFQLVLKTNLQIS